MNPNMRVNPVHDCYLSLSVSLIDDDDDNDLTEEEEWVRWCQVIREEEPLHHVGVHVGGRRSPGII